MNPADLLAHLRHRSAGTRPDDHVAAPTHTAPPGRCDETNPPAPKPPEPSQRADPAPRPIGQAWPSPRTWMNARLTEREAFREKRVLAELADLTDVVGPLAAAQAKFAPHLRKDQP
jgi:hypothetical protein